MDEGENDEEKVYSCLAIAYLSIFTIPCLAIDRLMVIPIKWKGTSCNIHGLLLG